MHQPFFEDKIGLKPLGVVSGVLFAKPRIHGRA